MGCLLDPNRRWPFLCECGRRTCREPVRLTVHEYDELSASQVRLVVAPGHERTRPRHVVKRTERFVVVEPDRKWGEDVR